MDHVKTRECPLCVASPLYVVPSFGLGNIVDGSEATRARFVRIYVVTHVSHQPDE
jgi:hypothetical protein